MFTGIIEGTGTVLEKSPRAESIRLVLDVGPLSHEVNLGDSMAVNGTCLTVVAREEHRLSFDLLRETEERTSLGSAAPGLKVNLERSLRADARLGGHFVTGHVDGTGVIRRWEQVGRDYLLAVEVPAEYARYVVPKGCLALDGMSLTVVDVSAEMFTVWIIPHTREVTNLCERRVGDRMNLEFDLLAKYTEKILQSARPLA